MGAATFVGIAASEIESACRALRIEFDADVLDDVQEIAKGAAGVLNKRK
jgi:hypothetical protein